MTDENTLQTRFQSESPADAVAELFQLYADRIYHLALGLLGDPSRAEDVVQETFLAAIKNRNQFQGRSSLSTWLYRIAYNEALEILRKRVEIPLEEEADEDDEAPFPHPEALIDWGFSPEQMLADKELRQQMDLAVSELPESLRTVFLLRDMNDLSTEEAAETLGISPGAIKVRLHRARLQLRERLAGYLLTHPENRSTPAPSGPSAGGRGEMK
jgi:RNA polymerase sigma-70 factor (ECF subfamily)